MSHRKVETLDGAEAAWEAVREVVFVPLDAIAVGLDRMAKVVGEGIFEVALESVFPAVLDRMLGALLDRVLDVVLE